MDLAGGLEQVPLVTSRFLFWIHKIYDFYDELKLYSVSLNLYQNKRTILDAGMKKYRSCTTSAPCRAWVSIL